MKIARSSWLPVVGLLASYAGAIGVGRLGHLEWEFKPQVFALPSVEVAKVTSLGFRNVLADAYFVQAAQYFGSPFNHTDNYKYLPPLVELVTELDEHFREPLLWGAIAVQRNLGNETWIHTAESTRFLKKGVARWPDDPRFYVFLAYNLAVFHHQYIEAAETLKKAIELPGCPAYAVPLVARLYSAAGDLEKASAFSEAMLGESQDPNVRTMMLERIKDIETERLARELDQAAELYRQRTGKELGSPLELVTSGVLPYLPGEPRGGGWQYDPEKHRIISDRMVGRLVIEAAPTRPVHQEGL